MSRPVRIANCSGFYGDRLAAAREMIDGGPIDVLTGDWLAELTMTILARSAMKGGAGYARTFVTQMRDVVADCKSRGIRVVSNAGGLDPQACAEAIREFAPVEVRIAVVTGDNLSSRIADLQAEGEKFGNLDTGEDFDAVPWPSLTANAYIGAAPVAAALQAGADIVITGRITDAALVVGPAAWWHGWDIAEDAYLDALAGATVAGHVIECGAQATGGNFPFFTDIPDLTHPGFPIAEVAADGTSVITKHWETGGLVSVGTVTAQLMYEVGGPAYLTPDVVARFDTVKAELVGANRVRLSGAKGEPAPHRLKVAMTRLGGFRNSFELVLTGLDIEAKADLALRATAGVTLAQTSSLDPSALAAASSWDVASLTVDLIRRDRPDPDTLGAAQAMLRITVKDADATKVGKPITAALIECGLSSYPGFYATSPPAPGSPFAVLWPTTVSREHVTVTVTLDGTDLDLPASALSTFSERQTPASGSESLGQPASTTDTSATASSGGTTPELSKRIPLGQLLGARSGDKGGAANIGVWVPDPTEIDALVLASGEASAWAPAVDAFHDTEAVWSADTPLPVDPVSVSRADETYQWLRETLTPDAVAALLANVVAQGVEVYHFPLLRAINIVLPGALGRGVADSTSVDPQAKSLGEYLRARHVAVPQRLLDATPAAVSATGSSGVGAPAASPESRNG